MTVIEVKNLKKYYQTHAGFFGGRTATFKQGSNIRAVDDVSFTIKEKSVHALVGESGCGKSTISRMLLRLIEKTDGEIIYKGQEIFGLKGDALKAYRRAVQIVFQDPYASLNPRMKIVDTLSEPLKIHNVSDRKRHIDIVRDIIAKVGLGEEVLRRYPHEFSGGQRQRICIARALMLSPDVIIADEPLSSLDVSIQAQILNLFKGLMDGQRMSLFFISHDLRVVRYLSDEISVMYLGKIVEQCKTDILFNQPLHPYTKMLIESAPKINIGNDIKHKSKSQGNEVIEAMDVKSSDISLRGCPFYPRCYKRMEICAVTAPLLIKYNERLVACHLYG